MHYRCWAAGPAALIARHRLRHKTRKQPFRVLFWMTVAGNLAGLASIILGDETAVGTVLGLLRIDIAR